MRVLIVPDKFKGTLDARRVAGALARGWLRARPRSTPTSSPWSDGGDGFGPVVGGLLGAVARSTRTIDAAGNPIRALWWWSASTRTAILETARSNGLALLQRGQHHPFDLDTTGVASLARAALEAGALTCLMGVGGSATNDGGFGLVGALGWRFFDRDGLEIQRWPELVRLTRVESPSLFPGPCRFVVATDVGNPLLGRQGASRVYGPQKGLLPADMPTAEAALRRLASVDRQSGFDSRSPGSGAAGGLGFGLQAFLGAERRLGFDLFAELAGLEQRAARADVVVTGEGSFDPSSLMGKGVGELLELAARHGRPVLVAGGRVVAGRVRHPALLATRGLVDIAPESEALRAPAPLLSRIARAFASDLP